MSVIDSLTYYLGHLPLYIRDVCSFACLDYIKKKNSVQMRQSAGTTIASENSHYFKSDARCLTTRDLKSSIIPGSRFNLPNGLEGWEEVPQFAVGYFKLPWWSCWGQRKFSAASISLLTVLKARDPPHLLFHLIILWRFHKCQTLRSLNQYHYIQGCFPGSLIRLIQKSEELYYS
jgi:hypothetical protein